MKMGFFLSKRNYNGRKMMKENKRGISPVIATVLLIAIVIVVAAIIFLWVRGLMQESVTKFGKNIELACADVQLSASFDSATGTLYVTNDGNVPIIDLKIRAVSTDGSYNSIELGSGLATGESSESILENSDSLSKITIIPVIKGLDESGKEKNYVCGDNYGTEVNV